MAAITQPKTVDPPPQTISPGAVNPTADLAAGMPGFDPQSVINAHEANLAEYLNKPVQDILSRLGLPRPPDAPPPATPDSQTPPGAGSPVDPSQMIQPVTDALGTLGSGQLPNNADPTQMFQGITQALTSAAQPVQQALSGLNGMWQGASATAAGVKTSQALSDGAEVAGQATRLGESVSTAVASVQQAQVHLMAIINEFWAKIAAIGPNIIFPWGIAAAIQAATEAVTETVEVMTATQAALSAQAGRVAAVGAPVAVTAVPGLGTESLGPMIQMASGMASPAMQGVSAITQAAQSGNGGTPADLAARPVADKTAGGAQADKRSGAIGGGAGRPATGAVNASQLDSPVMRRSAPTTPTLVDEGAAANTAKASGAGMSGSPMGAPMGNTGKSGGDGSYNSATFLHLSNDQIVGDLGNAAPPVIGQIDPTARPDIEL